MCWNIYSNTPLQISVSSVSMFCTFFFIKIAMYARDMWSIFKNIYTWKQSTFLVKTILYPDTDDIQYYPCRTHKISIFLRLYIYSRLFSPTTFFYTFAWIIFLYSRNLTPIITFSARASAPNCFTRLIFSRKAARISTFALAAFSHSPISRGPRLLPFAVTLGGLRRYQPRPSNIYEMCRATANGS